MKKSRKSDRVESFGEINSREDCSRARSGFVKPSRDRWRKIKNLIKSRPSKRKPAWRREKMELDSRKKSRRDRVMRSKSFATQEVREIGRKEAGESRVAVDKERLEAAARNSSGEKKEQKDE